MKTYYDSFAGLIPCKIVAEVAPSLTAPIPQRIIQITKHKGPYLRGEELDVLRHRVVVKATNMLVSTAP